MSVLTPNVIIEATAVSGCPSLPILDVVDHFGRSSTGPSAGPVDLLAALTAVPGPRSRRGIRYEVVAVLAIGVCAVFAGARTFTVIAEWAHDLPIGVRLRLGLRRETPSESTIRRVLQAVDAEALDVALSAWLVARSTEQATAPTSRRRLIAIDGLLRIRGWTGGEPGSAAALVYASCDLVGLRVWLCACPASWRAHAID